MRNKSIIAHAVLWALTATALSTACLSCTKGYDLDAPFSPGVSDETLLSPPSDSIKCVLSATGEEVTVSWRDALNISFLYNVISEASLIARPKNYPNGIDHGFAVTINGRINLWGYNPLVYCAGRSCSIESGMESPYKAIGRQDLSCYNRNRQTTDSNCHAVDFANIYSSLLTLTAVNVVKNS